MKETKFFTSSVKPEVMQSIKKVVDGGGNEALTGIIGHAILPQSLS